MELETATIRRKAQSKPVSALTLLSLAVITAGVITFALAAVKQIYVPDYTWLTMVALALLAAPMRTIYIPGVKARLALGDTITFACAAIFGLQAAVIAEVVDGTVTSLRMTRKPRKILYNAALCAVSMGGAGLLTRSLFPSFGGMTTRLAIGEMAAALGLFTVCYFLISTSLVAAYLALSNDDPFLNVWRENMLWTSVSSAASGVSALIVYILVGTFGYASFLIPVGLMVVVYLFYHAYFQKVESANQRVDFVEEKLRQSQKLEALGRLAGGVAHDFNNLLTAILIYSEILLEALDPNDPMRKQIEEISKAGDRASSLTRQLLAFSRKQRLQPKAINLNSVIEEMRDMLRRLIGEDIDLVTTLDPELSNVKADPGQIEQVIMNLALNCRDAMAQGGRTVIETANVVLNGANSPPSQSGPYVVLKIGDSGCGMDKETLSRIFEPFFTTKEQGKGTGLGLSTVYGIVNQSSGHIQVESEPGRGTTFSVYLPRCDEEVVLPEIRAASGSLPLSSGTILLVENDEIVRGLIKGIFRRSGYTVVEGAQGKEALKVSEQHKGPIHLLVADVVMPQMSGCDLAQQLILSRPDLKVLYISGHAEDVIFQHGVLVGEAHFLQKPFQPETLMRKVRELIGH
ncbi:MAG TPA: ATP-binding protein [Blastocatellia bacterium]|jgi:signal transduction histidine kinase/CheY-like chemotaxis protein|nr:ATP-binding protein [Blastocatellia bacterium]